MTDDELEGRLRRYRVVGPSADLRRRALAVPHCHGPSDFAIGWIVAGAVAACLCVSAWNSDRALQERVETMLRDPDVSAQIQEATAILGEPAREGVVLTRLAIWESESRDRDASVPEGAFPW